MADSLIGKQVNNFVIRERIGQGGMATVYLAYQPSVNRPVALKIITFNAAPSERDEFRLRFAQEAQVIASLEHVHILPVYDYGIFDNEIAYIAMRLLRGGTLADLLANGPLELDRTAEIFTQIARGLNYAHSKGVIHRDLKPSNILFDESGYAYLSDFGLAKMIEGSLNLTQSDMIVGTPAYMSPEQLRGEALDYRSDIYSLGCILYHMLVGRQPFAVSSTGIISMIYQQLEKEPTPPRELNPSLSPAVEQVVLRALNKNRDARYATAEEMANALNQALGRDLRPEKAADEKRALSPTEEDLPTVMVSTDAVPTVKPPSQSRSGWLIVTAVVAVLVVAVVALNLGGSGAPMLTPSETPAFATLYNVGAASTELPTLPPTANATNTAVPTLLPTETELVVVTPSLAATQAVIAPPLTELADVTPPPELTETVVPLTGLQGQIAFVSDRSGNHDIYIVNADGSGSRNLTNNPASDEYPTWSPDGKQIAFMSYRDDPDSSVVYIMDADGGNLHRLLDAGKYSYFPAWSPDGTQIALTIYNDEGNPQIFIVDADGSDLRPVSNLPAKVGLASWSPDGESIAFMGGPNDTPEIYEINIDGTGLRNLTNDPAEDARPAWSPTGDQIAFQRAISGGNPAVYVMNSAGSDLQRLTGDVDDGYHPAWSPDGKQIVFASYRGGYGLEIYIMNADGSNVRRLTNSDGDDDFPAWGP